MEPVIPRNIEAEIAVIGSLLLDENLIISAKDQLIADDFFEFKHKVIYGAIIELFDDGKGVDITTLLSYLTKNNSLEKAGDIDYLNKITSTLYATYNFDTYLGLVKDAALKRNTIKSLEKIVQEGYKATDSANDYLTKIETMVFDLSKKKKTGDFSSIEDLANLVRENAEKNSKMESGLTGLDTGFKNLNQLTSGFQKETLLILAARPAMGKSAYAMNLAVQIAANNKRSKAVVAIFSLEMGSDQLVERMVASDGRIGLGSIKKGQMTNDEWRSFNTSTKNLSNLNLYFDDSSNVTVSDIRSKCRKLASTKGLDFVVIDYLQLIAGDEPGRSKQEEVAKISRNLKLMARELQVPVLALAQLSREVEKRPDKKPIMADLRDSGSIEQDADMVMFLYRDEYYNKETSARIGEADLIVGKNRSGSIAELLYTFVPEQQKFNAIEKDEGGSSND